MNEEARFQAFRDRIGDRSIQALMTDSHGVIWVSASSGGLWRIKPETGEISELPPENGRPVPNIRQVFEDRERQHLASYQHRIGTAFRCEICYLYRPRWTSER
jgi:ligand-binding sensor domain-containing protein